VPTGSSDASELEAPPSIPTPRDEQVVRFFWYLNTLIKCIFFISFTASRLTLFHVGETHDIDKRLTTHNDHGYSKGFTKAANDWAIALKFECKSKEDALYLERFIKRMKSRTFIKKIIQKPSILNDLLSQK